MTADPFSWGWGASDAALDGPAAATELAATAAAGPEATDGHRFGARHRDDLAALAALGLTHARLPLEWARIEPAAGRIDAAAVEHLLEVLAAARDLGVAVWGCLHDDTLPGWFAHDEHGFADERSRRYYWARHVEFVGETFGHLVHGWVPVHEPNRWAHRGWITGRRPPGRVAATEAFAAALEGAVLAAVEAARRLREGGRPVASSHWVVPLFPARPDPDSPAPAEAQAMTGAVDDALFGSFRRLVTEETLAVGYRTPVAVPGAREAFDLIGFSYRHAAAVRGDGALLPYPQALPVGPTGQVAWSHGFDLALHHVAESFPDRPVLVTGVGLVTADEGRRDDYARDVTAAVGAARAGGIDLRGLWWDTPIDPTPARAAGPGLLDGERSPRSAAAIVAAATTAG